MAAFMTSLFKVQNDQMVSSKEAISGRIVKIFGQSNNFYHLQIQTDEGLSTVKSLSRLDLSVGMRISAMECSRSSDKYGVFFTSSCIIQDAPSDISKFPSYLKKQFPRLSSDLIGSIVSRFGWKTVDIFEQSPDTLLEVDGMTEGLLKYVKTFRNFSSIVDAVESVCAKSGFPSGSAIEIIHKFGQDSLNILDKDPYLLTQIPTIDYALIAKFAEGKTLHPDSKGKITFEIESQMAKGLKNGDTLVSREQVLEGVCATINVDSRVIHEEIERLLNKKPSPIVLRTIDGKEYFSLIKSQKCEKAIGDDLFRILEGSQISRDLVSTAKAAGAFLNDVEQLRAIQTVFESGVSVVTGGAGTGKSTITKIISEVAKKHGLRVRACALSNSATRRLSKLIDGDVATAHSSLGVRFGTDLSDNNSFRHNKNNPLEGDIFICDEFSMNDMFLCKSIFEAIPTGARLVIIGDAGQISSIGSGNVLRDIIRSGAFPVTQLVTSHRTGCESEIKTLSDCIRYKKLDELSLATKNDFKFSQVKSSSLIQHFVLEDYKKLREIYSEVQVLIPQYGTDVGIDVFNRKIRDLINPRDVTANYVVIGDVEWRVGDRILTSSKKPTLIQVCGDIGHIESIDSSEDDVNEYLVKVRFNKEVYIFTKEDMMESVELAFALSIHKSQGMEFQSVIFVAATQHEAMLNQNLLQTGFTRGREFLSVVGDEKVIRSGIGHCGNNRNTGLVLEIQSAASPKLLKKIGMRA